MINNSELKLFGQEYYPLVLEDVKWFWSSYGTINVSLGKGKSFRIQLKKLPESMSLTKLLVRLKDMSLKTYTKIDCYEGIPAISNNSDFSDEENYYLFSDGSVTMFHYHKYYRNRDEWTLKDIDKKDYNWDGVAYGMKCKRITKKLVDRIRSMS